MAIRDMTTGGVQSEIGSIRDMTIGGVQSEIGIVRDMTTGGVQTEIWRKEFDVFNAGAFGLGGPNIGRSEGYSYRTVMMDGAALFVDCDGRMDVWFPTPIPTGQYSTLNVTLSGVTGTANRLVGIAPNTTEQWLNAYSTVMNPTAAWTTYSMNVPAGTWYIGMQCLQCGMWISRIWLS